MNNCNGLLPSGFRCPNGHITIGLTWGHKAPCPTCKEIMRYDWAIPTGDLMSHNMPGGFPLLYKDDAGGAFCHECAADILINGYNGAYHHPITERVIHHSGPTVNCHGCQREIIPFSESYSRFVTY